MSLSRLNGAQWIWLEAKEEPNQYVQFIKDFDLTKKNATLYIAVDTCYAVFVNGQYVPGFAYSDFPDERSVDVLDISGYTKVGTNRLCVIAYFQKESSFCYKEGKPGLKFSVCEGERVVAVSDSETLCRISPDYQSGEMEKITFQIAYTFKYNASLNDGFLNSDYVPSSEWENAVCVAERSVANRPIK